MGVGPVHIRPVAAVHVPYLTYQPPLPMPQSSRLIDRTAVCMHCYYVQGHVPGVSMLACQMYVPCDSRHADLLAGQHGGGFLGLIISQIRRCDAVDVNPPPSCQGALV